jgi:hypothetical protein
LKRIWTAAAQEEEERGTSYRYFNQPDPLGSYTDLTPEVKNIGTGTLTGTVSASPPFSIVLGGSYSLDANQTQQVVVRYTAPITGRSSYGFAHLHGGGLTIQVKGTNKKNVGLPGLAIILED